jgi:hypothetical protein
MWAPHCNQAKLQVQMSGTKPGGGKLNEHQKGNVVRYSIRLSFYLISFTLFFLLLFLLGFFHVSIIS